MVSLCHCSLGESKLTVNDAWELSSDPLQLGVPPSSFEQRSHTSGTSQLILKSVSEPLSIPTWRPC